MNKYHAAVALLMLAVTSPAIASTAKSSFTRDGVTYVYTEAKVGKSTIYEGYAPGYTFHLVVRGNKVTGTANGMQVSFPVPAAKSGEASVTVATR